MNIVSGFSKVGIPAIHEIGQEKCTGCFGCYNVCPAQAVDMLLSEDGFYIPVVDESKCTMCGLCRNNCPVMGITQNDNRDIENVKVYAAWTEDQHIRQNSSSGGVFTEIAKEILNKGGTVFGAAWGKDFRSVEHIPVRDEAELARLRGSKYMQSNVKTVYRDIVDLTRSGKPALFTGVPCQTAALKTFVQADNLITVDLVCHGTPSITVYRKYLDYMAAGRHVEEVNFRDKSNGWTKFSMSIGFSDGSRYTCTYREDPFFIGFLSDLFINTPCYDCPFCSMPRAGDITLADYWGIQRELRDERGVSLCLSNNEKGDMLLQEVTGRGALVIHETGFSGTLRGNPRLVNGKLTSPALREQFFKELHRLSFKDLEEKYIQPVNRFKR